MRAFLGIEITQELREQIAVLQKHLQTSGADITWTAAENLHLTLKFLGEITREQAGQIKQAMTSRLSTVDPFKISLRGAGGFPNLENARVLWVGMSHGKEELKKLALAADKACGPLGFPIEEKPFKAHLTIGRVRSMRGHKRLVKQMDGISFRGKSPCPIDAVTLFHSELTRKGPIYSPLAQFALIKTVTPPPATADQPGAAASPQTANDPPQDHSPSED